MSRNSRHPQRPSAPLKGRWVIGVHSILEAIKVRPHAISKAYLKDGTDKNHAVLKALEKHRISFEQVPQKKLDELGSGHQGAAVLMNEQPNFVWSDLEKRPTSMVLLADGIQDPHNLGAMLRTGWLLGASAIFITEDRSVPMTPTVMKVASGGAEHLPLIPAGNLLDTVNKLKELGFWVYGLAGEASQNLWDIKFPEKVALVIGNEESGLRSTLSKACDELVKIPQTQAAASFNASVALGIGLSEVARQHFQSRRKS